MFHRNLVIFLVASIAPALAIAQSATPCNVVDQQARIALELGTHTAKAEHKEIPVKAGEARQFVDTCIYTPSDTAPSSLTVTSMAMPMSHQTTPPSCDDKSIPSAGLFICSARVKSTLLTFVLMTKSSSQAVMKTVFPAQVERLTKALAGKAEKVSATR